MRRIVSDIVPFDCPKIGLEGFRKETYKMVREPAIVYLGTSRIGPSKGLRIHVEKVADASDRVRRPIIM